MGQDPELPYQVLNISKDASAWREGVEGSGPETTVLFLLCG